MVIKPSTTLQNDYDDQIEEALLKIEAEERMGIHCYINSDVLIAELRQIANDARQNSLLP